MKKTLVLAALMAFAVNTFAQSTNVNHDTKKKPKTEKKDKKNDKGSKKKGK